MQLLLFSFLFFLFGFKDSSAQNIYLNNKLHPNNSAIDINDIGEGNQALSCRTTQPSCCKTTASGEWYYPNQNQVPIASQGENFYRNRDDNGNVFLNRRNNAQTPRGAYMCILPTHRGTSAMLRVFIYIPEDYPEVVEHPADHLNVPPDTNVTFTVSAIRSTSYQWQHNGVSIAPNPTKYLGLRSTTLTILDVELADEGMYSCVVGNRILSVDSNMAQLSLLSPPILVAQPMDMLDIQVGSDATFFVVVEGLHLNYVWQRADETLLTDEAKFVGVTTNLMTIQNVEFEDSGLYVCVISNQAGIVRSEGATLTVKGVPEEITSFTVTSAITSAVLNWTTSTSSPNLTFEIQYFPVAVPSHTIASNTMLMSHEIVGLIPMLQYEFRVRIYANEGYGDWTRTQVSLVRRIPPVNDLQMSISNGTSIHVSWSPTNDLPGWSISYFYFTYRAKHPDTDKTETSFRRTVGDGRTSLTMDVSSLDEREEVIHEFEVVPVLEITSVEGIGEVKGERALINYTLNYEKLPFQVAMTPVQYCIDWEVGKSDRIEKAVQGAVLAAIRAHCNCDPSESVIEAGVFSCRGRETAVTYRSMVKGLNATQLIHYIQDWVSSGVTIRMDWYLMDVYSDCPTAIAELEEQECDL